MGFSLKPSAGSEAALLRYPLEVMRLPAGGKQDAARVAGAAVFALCKAQSKG